MIDELDPKVMFEYIGGSLPSKVFSLMPENSKMFVLSNMKNKPLKL